MIEAQGWRLHLGAEPFITLAAGLEIKPAGGNRFEKRAPGGQWVRANPIRDFPQGDLVPLQRACNLFIEVVHLQQGAGELSAAIEEFKRECQRLLGALRSAKSPVARDDALAQLRTFFDEQQEVLPVCCRKELLEAEFTTLLEAFRVAGSAQESDDLRGQLRDFFRKHQGSGAERWEEIFIREEHQKEYRDRLEGLSRAASPDDNAQHKEQLLAFANKYEQYLPGNPMVGIQAAWTRALENNIPPAVPAGLKASASREDGISLSWNNCLGASQYQVYRSESDAPETRSFLNSVPVPTAVASSSPAFLDSRASAGRDYFYWVTATNPKGEGSFAGPVNGRRIQPVAQSGETTFVKAPPELTARMMKAMEEGDMLPAIEIYTLNLAYAGVWVGMLNEALEVCLENAREAKRLADAPAVAAMLANHKAIQRKLRTLIKADGNPARIRALTKISARNNDFVAELDEQLRNLNQQKAKAGEQGRAAEEDKAEAEDTAAAQARQNAEAAVESREEDNLRAEGEAKRIAEQQPAAAEKAAAEVEARRPSEASRSLAQWAGVGDGHYVNLAMVFTDIVGSTMLNSKYGDASWDEIRSAHFRQARSLLKKMHGWYIKDVGDAVVAVFKNAVDALLFAMELEKNTGHDTVRITAGAHIGAVIIRGNDIFGNEVNLAARIQGKSKEGGVWVSEGVRTEWRSRYGKNSLDFTRHEVEIRGLEGLVTLWSVPPARPPIAPDATVLTEAAAAAAAGKPEEVQKLLDQHGPVREQLIPHLHQAIQVKVQARANEATTVQAVESLKGLLQTYKAPLKSQPMLTKALESLVVQTEARVNAETKIRLLEKKILAEARKRAAVATSPEDIQLLDQWLDQQMSQLPAQNPALASELKALVTQAQQTMPQPMRTAGQGGKEDWKQEALICGQAKRLADEGDWNGVQGLIADNARWAPRLNLFLKEAVQTDIRRQALYTTSKAGLVALEESIEKHRALLDQDAELTAEFDELIRQAKGAIKTGVKKKVLWLILILAGLIAAGLAIGHKF